MEITPELLLQAYRIGVFPMGERRDDPKLYWLDPRLRAVLPLDGFHLPQRLKRTIRAGRFAVSVDTAFADTVRACAEPRPGHPESWINEPIVDLYTELHRRGHAHSVECRVDGRLVGGRHAREAGVAGVDGEEGRARREDPVPAGHVRVRRRRLGPRPAHGHREIYLAGVAEATAPAVELRRPPRARAPESQASAEEGARGWPRRRSTWRRTSATTAGTRG